MYGPTIIFDKSALQSFNVDESCWLDNFFFSNITPLFYVETLADLEKHVKSGRTPQQVVGTLALKTPSFNCLPNFHHRTLFVGNLLGLPVHMTNRPVIHYGQQMQSAFGIGTHYQQFPEMEAFQRWQQGDFLTIERNFALQWRKELSYLSFESGLTLAKGTASQRFRDLYEVKSFVDQFMHQIDEKFLLAALCLHDIPVDLASKIVDHWVKNKQPDLSHFAPYAAYVIKVDLFFYLSLASDLISKYRPSNKADIAYLYYLPFTMVFVSGDKLHAKTAPLFMEMGQVFIYAPELKTALKQLDDYYSMLPDDIKDQGIIRFVPHPPDECKTLVSDLWNTFFPGWRKSAISSIVNPASVEPSNEMTVEYLETTLQEAIPNKNVKFPLDEPDYTLFESVVPRTKGKWNIVPHDLD